MSNVIAGNSLQSNSSFFHAMNYASSKLIGDILPSGVRKSFKDSDRTSGRSGGSRKRQHTNWQRASAS
jgi:hypothetical protein